MEGCSLNNAFLAGLLQHYKFLQCYINPALAYNVTQHENIDNNLNILSLSLHYGRTDALKSQVIDGRASGNTNVGYGKKRADAARRHNHSLSLILTY